MTSHIIDDLRPDVVDVDPHWDVETLRTIVDGAHDDRWSDLPSRWRWPARLAFVAAAIALIVGTTYVAGRHLPRDDVRPAAPAQTPVFDGDSTFAARMAKDMERMDSALPPLDTDRTFEGRGTQSFSLGAAAQNRYIVFKLAFECVDHTKYLFILNGDRNAASLTCGERDNRTDGNGGTFGDIGKRVGAGSKNVVTIEVNQDVRYFLKIGYRDKSTRAVGPEGTLPDGRTYGFALDEDGNHPDLVPVKGVSGVSGYADWILLQGGLPSSPAEAVSQQKLREQRYRDGERIDRTIPVYDKTGRQVDVYEVMLPKP